MARREGNKKEILVNLSREVADAILEMEIGSKASISAITHNILSGRGYEHKHIDTRLGYCWTKDSSKTYIIQEDDLFEVLYQVSELLEGQRKLDFSEFADSAVGLPFNIPFTIKDAKEAEKAFVDSFHAGNKSIEDAISAFYKSRTAEGLMEVLEAIRVQMHEDGHFIVPVIANAAGDEFTFCTLKDRDGLPMFVAFTSQEEFEKGEKVQCISHFIDMLLKAVIDNNQNGFIINPWGQSFLLTRELIEIILEEDEKRQK